VPLYTPLALPLTREEGLDCVSPKIRGWVESGTAELLATAHGEMVERGEVQFILL
jgi:hypothetical protein